ncbi:MAG: response regulator [bacterium]|nr:response regulator [bacterium]
MATIMIADDVDMVRRFIRRIVEDLGHTPVEAENGEVAWQKFQRQPIDLFVVDVKMPEMDGVTFLHKVKEKDPHAVIIMVTGFPSADAITETIEEEAYTYVTKPLKVDQMRDLIERGLEFRKAQLKAGGN